VQGVCFRAATEQQAGTLLLRGFVRNLQDGRVEIVAEGAGAVLQKLVDWSHKGPFMAKVEKVVTEDIESSERFNDFEIR
jgi:acylphosphatase